MTPRRPSTICDADVQVLLLLSFANGMPGPEETLTERAFSLAIAGRPSMLAGNASTTVAVVDGS